MRLSHQDIENRVDDEEEMSRLRASIEVEEVLDGMQSWIEEQEASAEWQAELAEHLSSIEMGEAVVIAVEAADDEPSEVSIKLGCDPIPVYLVREDKVIVLS